jgi:single-strand DNA-binding protein
MNTLRNHVQLIGHLGRNPEVKTLENGKKIASFQIACTESYNDANGRKIENTQWFSAVAWEGLAGIAEKYMHKGKQVAISGKLNSRHWMDKEGKKHYVTEIVCSDILLLGAPKKAE